MRALLIHLTLKGGGVGRGWVSGMSGRKDESLTNTFDSELEHSFLNNTRCLTRRGGGDGSAVARRGADEARANCLVVTVQQSRGAVLTRRVPIACILTVTTRGVCAVAVTGQRCHAW
ncbi:hypothetical protein J6590_099603 [Homalodisca vitripennis]|nr:hypothetical protein J6590_099603 [Homalodisca vitripennis]